MSRTVSDNPHWTREKPEPVVLAEGDRVRYTAYYLSVAGIPKTNEMWRWRGTVLALEGPTHVRVQWGHAPSPTWRVECANLRRAEA